MNGPDREPLADILRGETRFWRDVHAPLLKSFVDDLLYNGSRHIDNRNDDGESYYFLSRLLAILLWLLTAGGGEGREKIFSKESRQFRDRDSRGKLASTCDFWRKCCLVHFFVRLGIKRWIVLLSSSCLLGDIFTVTSIVERAEERKENLSEG